VIPPPPLRVFLHTVYPGYLVLGLHRVLKVAKSYTGF
jgi:hypothetical protein